jgi:hypothetical protein
MKKILKTTIVLYSFFVAKIVFAQSNDDYAKDGPSIFSDISATNNESNKVDEGVKNAIQVNLFSFVRGYATVGYERALTDNIVVGVYLGPSYMNPVERVMGPEMELWDKYKNFSSFAVDKPALAKQIILKIFPGAEALDGNYFALDILAYNNNIIAKNTNTVYNTLTGKSAYEVKTHYIKWKTTEARIMYGLNILTKSNFTTDLFTYAGLKVSKFPTLEESNSDNYYLSST